MTRKNNNSTIKRILIVDDEPGMTETLTDILEYEGFKVSGAGNGDEALAFLKTENVEIILMDFKMPGMNGVELFREVRKINAKAKTIFITAYYQEKLIQKAIEEGAVGLCNKPLNIPKLLKIIRDSC